MGKSAYFTDLLVIPVFLITVLRQYYAFFSFLSLLFHAKRRACILHNPPFYFYYFQPFTPSTQANYPRPARFSSSASSCAVKALKSSSPSIKPRLLPLSNSQCTVPISSTTFTVPRVPHSIGLGSSPIEFNTIHVPGGYAFFRYSAFLFCLSHSFIYIPPIFISFSPSISLKV